MARRLLGIRSGAVFAVAVWASLGYSGSAQERTRHQPEEAWWLTATFTPTETSYEGLAAEAIDPEWKKLATLAYEKLPPAAKDDLVWMRRDGFAFRTERRSKENGATTRNLVGVYETNHGERGRFLLVVEKTSEPSSPWKVAFLHKEKGEAGFSVLARRANGLYWGTCMQCDEFQKIVKKGKAYELDASASAP